MSVVAAFDFRQDPNSCMGCERLCIWQSVESSWEVWHLQCGRSVSTWHCNWSWGCEFCRRCEDSLLQCERTQPHPGIHMAGNVALDKKHSNFLLQGSGAKVSYNKPFCVHIKWSNTVHWLTLNDVDRERSGDFLHPVDPGRTDIVRNEARLKVPDEDTLPGVSGVVHGLGHRGAIVHTKGEVSGIRVRQKTR